MKDAARLFLMIVGAFFVASWLIGTFVPGYNFRACAGPASGCKLTKEQP